MLSLILPDILLNVFLAIAVDNLAEEDDEEEKGEGEGEGDKKQSQDGIEVGKEAEKIEIKVSQS